MTDQIEDKLYNSMKLTREDITHLTSIQRSPGLEESHFPVGTLRRLEVHDMISRVNGLIFPDLPEA